MPDSALNRRSEALGGWKANNASFGHQIIPRTVLIIDTATQPPEAVTAQATEWLNYQMRK